MPDGFNGMVKHHPRSGPSHDLPHLFPHLGLVAMDRAFFTGGFVIGKSAMIQPHPGIAQQLGAIGTKAGTLVTMTAIESDHQLYGLFFLADPVFHLNVTNGAYVG